MRIEITSRSLELSDTMRSHIEKKLQKLRRYLDGVIECHVIAKTERFAHKLEITLHGKGFDFFSEASAEDFYVAFENAVDKMERQMRKLKDKMRTRRSRKAGLASVSTVESEETEEFPDESEGG